MRVLISALAIALMAGGLGMLVVALRQELSSGSGPRPEWLRDESTLTGFTLEPPLAPVAADDGAGGGEAGTPQAALARIAAAHAGIDAPLVVLGVDSQGVMEAPGRPDVVGWYDFSARPGSGSNAVFSGHLDFAEDGPAVFWRLKELHEGDEVQLTLADGTVYSYKVISSSSFNQRRRRCRR